ncbi:nitroreductase family protein [Nostocaceae cyanobacterium CENA357]|uniref:Nitroreductase family protein n=1 Tax=Atlanticothrix silvestris CENA357 TaxID=1725252 RepID=A0A8J7L0X8_9CYAN|nr:nitroreductase family protein [Atlanticothrix silvestris]MBH8552206.1 nitroreductase family protein [Atlanticothrix silvestris CENA357]
MFVEMKPYVGLIEAIKQRRAARTFKSDRITEAILQEILELSLQAPSGFNLQPWRFIVVTEQENKDQLQACAFNQRQVGEAPVVLICCGDRQAKQIENITSVIHLGEEAESMTDSYANYMRSSIPEFFTNHPSFETMEAWTNRHTMLAVAYMMLVAKSFGVDSCPMEGFVSAQVKEAFDIPEEVDICCLLALGYANEPFKQYGGRFPLNQVCFHESYGEPFGIH